MGATDALADACSHAVTLGFTLAPLGALGSRLPRDERSAP